METDYTSNSYNSTAQEEVVFIHVEFAGRFQYFGADLEGEE